MDAFFLIDKPIDMNSFLVVKKLKKILDTKKIGHTGTLDPLATGLLLVACGSYTKLIPYFDKDTKEYEFEIYLDGETESYDLGTPVQFISKEQQKHFQKIISKEGIKILLKNNFMGDIIQMPPKYSALKVGGQMAVRMVKSGVDFNLKERNVHIDNIELVSFQYPKAKLKASVSAGTYIRTIAHDLGQLLGCGAYVSSLRRTQIGALDLSSATTLEEMGRPLDVSKIFPESKCIKLDTNCLEIINNGLEYHKELLLENGEYFVKNGDYITNIVEYHSGKIKPKRRIITD